MRLYGSLEGLLAYEPDEPLLALRAEHPSPARDDALSNLVGGKLSSLTDILDDIAKDIRGRALLSAHLVDAVTVHYLYVKTKLHELYLWPIGSIASVDRRRGLLEEQLDKLEQEKRFEQRQCWQDIAVLKAEWRKWLKQYSDALLRTRLLLTNERAT